MLAQRLYRKFRFRVTQQSLAGAAQIIETPPFQVLPTHDQAFIGNPFRDRRRCPELLINDVGQCGFQLFRALAGCGNVALRLAPAGDNGLLLAQGRKGYRDCEQSFLADFTFTNATCFNFELL